MTISLPDVNVWIALAAEGHVHHVPARDWFTRQPESSVAFCRITQMAMLRLLTNASVMGGAPRTIAQAWDFATQFSADRRIIFAAEPNDIEEDWRQLMSQPNVGPSSWTDAYLAAFARSRSYMLVTFDRAFQRWTDPELILLSARN